MGRGNSPISAIIKLYSCTLGTEVLGFIKQLFIHLPSKFAHVMCR